MRRYWERVATARGFGRARALGLTAVCATIFACLSPFRPGVVMGDSMAPSLQSGQVFLMSHVSPRMELQPGDVVVLQHEGDTLVKRVAAVAGEVLWGIDWSAPDGNPDILLTADEADYVVDFLLRHPAIGEVIRIEVPPGHLFVVGDAPNRSWDSRQFGTVPVEEVRARVILPRPTEASQIPVLRPRSAVCGAGHP